MGTLVSVIVVAGGVILSTIFLPSSNPDATHAAGTLLFGNIPITDLPDGLFKNLLTFWESLNVTFNGVLETLGNTLLDVIGFSPLSIFIGGGLAAYIGYVVVRWVLNPS